MHDPGRNDPFDSALYDSALFLVSGLCRLWPAALSVHGSMEVGKTPELLKYRSLRIEVPGGQWLAIVPVRMEYSPSGPTLLQFDIDAG
jgi:hypothetical protein